MLERRVRGVRLENLPAISIVNNVPNRTSRSNRACVALAPIRSSRYLQAVMRLKMSRVRTVSGFRLALQKRIRFWEKAKIKAQNDLKEAQNQIEVIKEEARTTSVNYENQLSLMSEHLANMNDKLTKQTDEIERLKFEVGNKKKGSK